MQIAEVGRELEGRIQKAEVKPLGEGGGVWRMLTEKGPAGEGDEPIAEPRSQPGGQNTQEGDPGSQLITHEARDDKAKLEGEGAAGGESKDDLKELLELGGKLDEITPKDLWREDETGKVWERSWRDWWIEENLWIRKKKGGKVRFELNKAQREYSRRCGKQNIVLKARQVGITTYIAARFFVETITYPGTLSMQVAHDRESAEEIFRIVHRFWDNLDEKYRKGPLRTSHSSARELVFPGLDSEYTVASADENAGRGRTVQNLHCTEVSRWGREGEEALVSLRAAVVPGGEIVLESTANGAWGLFYQEWEQAGETGYTQHFFPWWYEGSYRSEPRASFEMTSEEAVLARAQGLEPEQIAWRRQQWSRLRGLAAQEFAEDAVTCFRASGACMFELEVIEAALAGVAGGVETSDNGQLCVWLVPQPGTEYVIGVDPAGGGVNGDYSCAQVIDRKDGMQCAELLGHIAPREMADKVCDLAKRYNDALLAVERNNHGHAVLARLVDTLKYTNLYCEGGQPGWNTTAVSRPPMIANLGEVLVVKPELFQSARLWNECRTFVRSANGTPGAGPGAHDDCVIAMAIALAVRKERAGKSTKKKGEGGG